MSMPGVNLIKYKDTFIENGFDDLDGNDVSDIFLWENNAISRITDPDNSL